MGYEAYVKFVTNPSNWIDAKISVPLAIIMLVFSWWLYQNDPKG
jgi:hypothetical protein